MELTKKFVVYDTLSGEMHQADTIEEAESDLKEVVNAMACDEVQGHAAYLFEVKAKGEVSFSPSFEGLKNG